MLFEEIKEFVFLIGMIYPFGELNIFGIYTDKNLLIRAYDKLIKEDCRCTDSKYPTVPEIYKIPLNQFIGEKIEITDERFYFLGGDNMETVCIDELRQMQDS